jgi:hypothetical protein
VGQAWVFCFIGHHVLMIDLADVFLDLFCGLSDLRCIIA